MESPRITLARALELGVHLSWREASAIVHEAVVATRATEGVGPARVTAESCVLTRGGDVVLVGTAAQARPEAVVRLLDDLLASCSNPGRFADAVANGTALVMIEDLSQHTTPKRRRVEVASVALRGLAAAAEAAREGTAPGNAMAPPIGLHRSAGHGSERDAAAGHGCQARLPSAGRLGETCQRRSARVFGPRSGRRRDPDSSNACDTAVGGRAVRAGGGASGDCDPGRSCSRWRPITTA